MVGTHRAACRRRRPRRCRGSRCPGPANVSIQPPRRRSTGGGSCNRLALLAVVTARMPVIALAAVLMLVARLRSSTGPARRAGRTAGRADGLQDAVRRPTAAGAGHGPGRQRRRERGRQVGRHRRGADEEIGHPGHGGRCGARRKNGVRQGLRCQGCPNRRKGRSRTPFSSWRRCPNR